MRSIETSQTFPLASVKPLDALLNYRAYCLAQTREVSTGLLHHRTQCPEEGMTLVPCGMVDGFAYARCPQSGSLFLVDVPHSTAWARLLARVNQFRHSPQAFHTDLAQSRTDHVYAPKLEWIQDTLRLQQADHPVALEVATPPSHFAQLLWDSGVCAEVQTIDEMELAHAKGMSARETVQVAVLLESLDRIDDPAGLLRGVLERLSPGGLIFVTGLVSSGFDMATLGLHNRYLYPPDRANCFSLQGLSTLLTRAGFSLLEVSTPGVLDLEVVQAHLQHDVSVTLSTFERRLVDADEETRAAFQAFLQQRGLSSFARIVGRKS